VLNRNQCNPPIADCEEGLFSSKTWSSSRPRHLEVLHIVLPDCVSPDLVRGTHGNQLFLRKSTSCVGLFVLYVCFGQFVNRSIPQL